MYSIYAFVFYSSGYKKPCPIHIFHCVPWHSKDQVNVSKNEIKLLKDIILLIFNLEEGLESGIYMGIKFTTLQFLVRVGH